MVKSARGILCGISLGLLLPGPANAQEAVGSAVLGDSAAAAPGTAPEEPVPGLKSGTTALLLSFLGTAVPAAIGASQVWESQDNGDWDVVMLVGALVLGPSMGHFYAGRPGPAFVGIGIRMVAGAGVALALVETGLEDSSSGYEALGVVGAVIAGASLVWDIARAPHSARVYNDKLRQERMTIGMTLPGRGSGPGLRAQVHF